MDYRALVSFRDVGRMIGKAAAGAASVPLGFYDWLKTGGEYDRRIRYIERELRVEENEIVRSYLQSRLKAAEDELPDFIDCVNNWYYRLRPKNEYGIPY